MAQNFDWERIQAEYRANQLSIREIAKRYGPSETAIRKRAKREDWQRDLKKQVKKKTSEKLVRNQSNQVRNANAGADNANTGVSDEEIIEEAASRGAQVVESHRKDIQSARNTAKVLMQELHDGTVNAELVGDIVAQHADEQGMTDQARRAAERAISLPQRASVLRDLSTAMSKFQSLERKAFSLDDEGGEEDYEEQLKSLVED